MLLALLTFSQILALQLTLDRQGFSPNAADGQWGRRSQSALEWWASANGCTIPASLDAAYSAIVSTNVPLFRVDIVTQAELDSLTPLPKSPADKARLTHLGYTTIREMYAERGHITENTLTRLNPNVNFNSITVGACIRLPDFPSIESSLRKGGRAADDEPRTQADHLTISLAKFEVVAFDEFDHPLAVFPCSIAKDKTKAPQGTLKVITIALNPNYTYTPESGKGAKHILPAGPNNPVGVVWIGLNLAGYGIHGTPTPETIGRAESHGCFRLANWNVARLSTLITPSIPVHINAN